ncbi:MAG: glycosyltransferase family 39 protein [Bacteroidetes bacterium]|nr:glycosyltransferase family 39 protein [Bacteroidota bacterium]
MPKLFRRLSADDALITIIMIIGALLRLYRLSEIPFTHDEFSAILRTGFATFHDLIEKGIKIDGHPAGVQVFLYYMVKYFGVSEAVLKAPFILFGVISIWLVYRIGKDWFNSTVGLVVASFVAFLQFPVMYSQIARPYASGLFFVLMMVFFWTRVIFHPQRKYYLNLAGYVISGALCTYNHHFSMLFAAMVGISGLFFCSADKMRKYVAGGLLIVVLYLPHLPILLYQLGIGGIEGWLSKPGYNFIFDYVQYIFHFSIYIYLLIIILISLSLYWYQEIPPVRKKFILISLIWFLMPYIIGFIYSKYRSSVLQYSVLLFSFPFLLFVLFGFFKTEKALHKTILVALIGLIVIPSLIIERQHYKLFYHDAYREIVVESKHAVDSLGINRCAVILDTKKDINQYYLEKLTCEALTFNYLEDQAEIGGLAIWLDSCTTDFLAFGSLTSSKSENYAMMMEKFPFLIRHKSYCGGDFYLFSRKKPEKPSGEYFYSSVNTFEPSSPDWGWVNDKRCIDSLTLDGKKSYVNDLGSEFSPAYTKSLRDLIRTENDVIDVSVDVRLPPVFPGAWLVASISSEGKDLKWSSAAINDFVKPGHHGTVFISLRISDIDLRHHRLMFNTYIWNPVKSPYLMDNFKVRVRSGNPVIYGLYRKVGEIR